MQMNAPGLLVTLEIAYLIQRPLTMGPRCRRNVDSFIATFCLYICLSNSLLIFICD